MPALPSPRASPTRFSCWSKARASACKASAGRAPARGSTRSPKGRSPRRRGAARAAGAERAAILEGMLGAKVRRRYARKEDLGLSEAELGILRRLDTPQKIQAFLYRLKQNFELHGDTCRP